MSDKLQITDEELLQYIRNNSIINLADVREQIEMKKRQELLAMHPYSIWCGKDEKWYTYLPDQTKNRKKVLKKRTSQKAIEDLVVEYWKDYEKQNSINTFRDVYFLWRETQDKLVCDNTVAKYESDYRRYFEQAEFSDMQIKDVRDDDIKVFMCQTITRLELGKETSRKLFGYISNTILCARKNGIISDNPVEFLKAKDFYRYCTEKYKPIEKEIVVESDMKELQERFVKDHEVKPEYIPTYAVEFAALTGMRVGEISALRWDCITDDFIVVDKSEKSNRKKNIFRVEKTKNGLIRRVPMTKEIKKLLEKIESVERQYGFFCEWVFANEDGRVHAKTISACSKTKCRQLGIAEKGIHAYRKTLNSEMKRKGVPTVVAASILGHTKEVNDQYYTFDITDIKEKSRIISEINASTIER